MSFDLIPKNKNIKEFHCSFWAWFRLIEKMGYFFCCIQKEFAWKCNFGLDKRMGPEDDQPHLLTNDGFEVTRLESKMIGRIIKNYITLEAESLNSSIISESENFINFCLKSGGFRIT